jgi:uncharacterized membrane protein
MAVAQAVLLRPDLGGVEGWETVTAGGYMLVAGAFMGIVSWATWALLDDLLGRALIAQGVAVGLAIAVGLAVYSWLVSAMGLEEARQIRRLFADRLRRPGSA